MALVSRWSGVAAVASVMIGAEASADELAGTRADAMRERDNRIELRLEPGYATMVVRRTVHNESPRVDEAWYSVWLPDLAVATGLRLRGGGRWHEGALLPASSAWDRYERLTGVDAGVARARGDVALLATLDRQALSLALFPVPAGGSRTVEYTIDMPLQWREEGRWGLDLGWFMGVDDRPPELVVHAVDARDRLFVDDRPVASGHRVVLDDDYSVALAPRDRRAVTAELAALDTGSGRSFVHWQVALAQKFTRIPAGLRVVVALDASRSLGVGVAEAQRRAALAYLEHLRGPGLAAKVAVIGFDRRVHMLSGGWVSAETAIARLRAASFERHNGSDVGLALREAGALLATQPEGAPRRVLVLTDFLTPSAHTLAQHEAAALGTGAVVHLAVVLDSGIRLERDDGHAWAPVAERTQGVVWQAGAADPEDDEDRGEMRAVFEEWARPVRIDSLRVELGGPAHDDPTLDSLAEGEVYAEPLIVARPVGEMTVRGLTWNTAYVHTVLRSEPLSRRWASLVFAQPILAQLAEAEQAFLARSTRAVTPWTSYLVASPAAGPSREGFVRDDRDQGLIGKGGGGGFGTGYGRGSSAGFGGRLDRQAWLADELADRWRRCGGVGKAMTIDLEATFEEVVDFELRAPGSEATIVACMREATWTLLLPAGDFIDRRSRWRVRLGP